ncbi:bifunctional 3,4-dihydroxy-2-butanone 4-phosphate synthase/GTP cyclohydrolase II [Halobacteriovorax marinus]|uniref:3,4-dihydroxy-2-butanone-4-phosphate synthase n=1 Tax=Halobacteriovorax marinus TaxID=97084 RepID=UPI000BC313B5|nr:3,4-dihydroxy-2-butanone-4-phosphate synthase [Halobacteriovorax marinus]ATH06394.1 bifunctional 3,4-dihydroxy-2-butanone 4-phosphate synthase/GTP cyclohydrolase II [Halobacteriovorax marinus]
MFDSIESAIEDIRLGKIIIVIDDEDRENEGDFIMAADKVTPEAINFMATYGRGLICTPITQDRATELELDLMVRSNDCNNTAFTVSIDLNNGGTGISCLDRSLTTLALTKNETKANDFVRPGHIFPLIAKDGGVLERNGHTEAAVDFAKLAGCHPSGVICEIMNEDGSMARTEDLKEVARKHNLKFVTIKDLVNYRKKKDAKVARMTSEIPFPNKFGNFKLRMYEVEDTAEHHIAIVKGDISKDLPTLVRIHSECFTGDIFGSLRCDCGEQLENSMREIEKAGSGVVLYMRQEGRGIGLPNKIKAYTLQDQGLDTVDANRALGFGDDLRTYDIAISMLKDIGVSKVALMTNNPLKVTALEEADFEIVNRHPVEILANDVNINYLRTKKNRMNHLFDSIN